uniref:Secreted protein n=1 Tax=Streptomyces pratensis (strain ATCC 33331 / IAF-45CD) TaxID=591167 RepID=A0A8D4BIP1_STRFA
MSIVVIAGLAVIALGNPSSSADGPEKTPRPASPSVYPVKFPKTRKSTAKPRPQPTVSYPIRFPQASKTAARPRPRSTVTYPIPWDRSAR